MSVYYNQEIAIAGEGVDLRAELTIPEGATAILIFSQAGGSRHSRRSQIVAQHLQREGFGTLLPDLLTSEESQRYGARYDIGLLTDRMVFVTESLKSLDLLCHYQLAYYGTSMGAAAALNAAARLPDVVRAIVCRGGRPDLADSLNRVEAPTLLLVGDQDSFVLQLNRDALEQFSCVRRLEVIQGASHTFHEPGKMEEIDAITTAWFVQHLHPSLIVNQ